MKGELEKGAKSSRSLMEDRMYHTTLCIPVIGNPTEKILLGRKKRGFGIGKYNGFGGKLLPGESIRAGAVRELQEECGFVAWEKDLLAVGHLDFYFSGDPSMNHDVKLFLLRTWQGEERVTEEMEPFWFEVGMIPYEQMWEDDIHWLPLVLAGKKVYGRVLFGPDNEKVEGVEIREEESMFFPED